MMKLLLWLSIGLTLLSFLGLAALPLQVLTLWVTRGLVAGASFGVIGMIAYGVLTQKGSDS